MSRLETIAEIGINHNGSMETCKQLIRVSAECGFKYVKFQKRDPEVCVPANKRDALRETPWGTMRYIDYKHKIEFQQAEYDEIDAFCTELGIQWFASAFDLPSIDFLATYLTKGTSFANIIKLGSAAAIELDLCKRSQELFPGRVMLSLGMKTEQEIKECISIAQPFCVLHTVSVYPTKPKYLFLNYIKRMRRSFPDMELGYSGHESGLAPTFAAAALGCTWFERHVTLDKGMWGTDQSASLDPVEMKALIEGLVELEQGFSIAEGERYLLPGEREKRAFFTEISDDSQMSVRSSLEMPSTGCVALIPARGGSKRLPGKNIRMLLGKPLIAWTIDAALDSGAFDSVVVSTDSAEIAAVARKFGAKVHDRAPAAATDTALLAAVIEDFEAAGGYEYQTLAVLNPTNPLRGAGAIQSAASKFAATPGAEFLVCAKPSSLYLWSAPDEQGLSAPMSGYGTGDSPVDKPRTQDVEKHWVETGAMYFVRRGRWQGVSSTRENTLLFQVDMVQAVDIDHNLDFVVAEVLAGEQ